MRFSIETPILLRDEYKGTYSLNGEPFFVQAGVD